MAVNLSKGGRVNLEKEAPGLKNVLLGLGWDCKKADGADFDLDASLLMLGNDDKSIGENSFIFYNNKTSSCGSVVHQGDNLTGDGDGDDEVINVALPKIPENVSKMIIAVTIHDAEARNQNFGQVDNAFIRVANNDNNQDIARYDLTEDYSTETSLIFGELYRKNGEWRFVAKGDGFAGGLKAYLASYGIES
ncbi:MAG: TerD family protein [Mariprofundales bacterium]